MQNLNFTTSNYVFNNRVAYFDTPGERNKNKFLLCYETFNVLPQNYDSLIWDSYKGIITWNSKLYKMKKKDFNIFLIDIFPYMKKNIVPENRLYKIENKINGVILSSRHRPNTRKGDIAETRLFTLWDLNKKGNLICHCFGKQKYGEPCYKGAIGKGTGAFPSSDEKIIKQSKYKFAVCFENTYHPIWSYDYITEKIYDCFASKTIPIYWGCYNVEEHIPTELFIDYRQFKNNDDLEKYLVSFPMDKYRKMVNNEYDYYKGLNFNKWVKQVKGILCEN